jgi:hypothetical protein
MSSSFPAKQMTLNEMHVMKDLQLHADWSGSTHQAPCPADALHLKRKSDLIIIDCVSGRNVSSPIASERV